MMKKTILVAVATLISLTTLNAQTSEQDVFSPIGKYFQAGDYEKLSAWFADNLELDILGAINNCTRNQAKLIMKNFFTNNTPKKFEIVHKSGKAPMKYAIGNLSAGGSEFRVILFVKISDSTSYIQQIKIEKQ